MRDLEKALSDITAIRSQMARGTEFRGYGPMTIAATGVLALAAAALQALWLPDPAGGGVLAYVAIWVGAAALSAVLVGVEMVARTRRIHRGLADEMILGAIEKFMPAAVAGLLVTVVLYRFAPPSLWILPGLWQIIFSLGIFASSHSLRRQSFAAGLWYLLAGLANLALAQDERAFSPLAMGAPFAVGQVLIAAIVYRHAGGRDVEA